MRLSPPILGDPGPCSYLPDRDARLEYRLAGRLAAEEYASLLLAGHRRFGRSVFRPRCPNCSACRSLRVDVARFRPDRSQRRAWARNADLRIEVAEPEAGPAQLDLYRRYHQHQAGAKGWPNRIDEGPDDYTEAFVANPFASQEWRYFLDETMIAVGYVDDLTIGPSAIIFIPDPDHRNRSLGTFNVLSLIDHARRLARPHVYLGYHVAACGSLAYKARFRPYQVLGADGVWREEASDQERSLPSPTE